MKEQLKTIITSPIEEDEIEPFKKIKKLFQACMNKSKLNFNFNNCSQFSQILALIEERGLKPLTDIQEKLGGWPVIKGDAWNESKWSWQQSIRDLNKRGYSTDYIFTFSVELDLKNTTKRIISVSWPANHDKVFFLKVKSHSDRFIMSITLMIDNNPQKYRLINQS